MSKPDRKPGYYWNKTHSGWEICEWTECDWWECPGRDNSARDADFLEIGPRIPDQDQLRSLERVQEMQSLAEVQHANWKAICERVASGELDQAHAQRAGFVKSLLATIYRILDEYGLLLEKSDPAADLLVGTFLELAKLADKIATEWQSMEGLAGLTQDRDVVTADELKTFCQELLSDVEKRMV